MNYFILVASDTSSDDGFEAVSAYDVAIERLRASRWPIYPRTRNRALLTKGDHCLVYVAGQSANAQSIVGAAIVGDLIKEPMWTEPGRESFIDAVAFILKLTDTSILKHTIPVRPLLDQLSFITNTAVWGGAFQGGCRRIQKKDFEILIGSFGDIQTP